MGSEVEKFYNVDEQKATQSTAFLSRDNYFIFF